MFSYRLYCHSRSIMNINEFTSGVYIKTVITVLNAPHLYMFAIYSYLRDNQNPLATIKFRANALHTDFIAILVYLLYNVLLTCHLHNYNSNSVLIHPLYELLFHDLRHNYNRLASTKFRQMLLYRLYCQSYSLLYNILP